MAAAAAWKETLMVDQKLVAEGLVARGENGPVLLGGRVTQTGQRHFPRRPQVMLDDGQLVETEEVELPRDGVLWTYTTQGFPPPLPDFISPAAGFVPFALGYIELDEGLLVEARLTGVDLNELHIGMEMELVLETLGPDEDGNDVVTYAFAPRSGS